MKKLRYYSWLVLLLFVIVLVGCNSTENGLNNSNMTDLKNYTNKSNEKPWIPKGNVTTVNYQFIGFDDNLINVTYNMSENYLEYYQNKTISKSESYNDLYPKLFNQSYGDEVYNQIINSVKEPNDSDREILNKLIMFLSDMEYNFTEQYYYPYEVLNNQKGACTDKNIVMVELINELGYGAGLIDFPDNNHLAAGIKCESPQYGKYCIIDTTKYFRYITDNETRYEGRLIKLTHNYTVFPIYDGETYNASKDYEIVEKIETKREKYDKLMDKYDRIAKEEEYLNTQFTVCQIKLRRGETVGRLNVKSNRTVYKKWNISIYHNGKTDCTEITEGVIAMRETLNSIYDKGVVLQEWMEAAPGRGNFLINGTKNVES